MKNMPKGDKTGPEGLGPRSGRGLGYCTGYESPGYTKGFPRGGRGYGRGYARGFGRGFGWGRGRRYHLNPDDTYYPHQYPVYPTEPNHEMNKEDEKHYLENVVQNLENELKNIKNRLKQLGKNNKNEAP
jgi:hypothetical protein